MSKIICFLYFNFFSCCEIIYKKKFAKLSKFKKKTIDFPIIDHSCSGHNFKLNIFSFLESKGEILKKKEKKKFYFQSQIKLLLIQNEFKIVKLLELLCLQKIKKDLDDFVNDFLIFLVDVIKIKRAIDIEMPKFYCSSWKDKISDLQNDKDINMWSLIDQTDLSKFLDCKIKPIISKIQKLSYNTYFNIKDDDKEMINVINPIIDQAEFKNNANEAEKIPEISINAFCDTIHNEIQRMTDELSRKHLVYIYRVYLD